VACFSLQLVLDARLLLIFEVRQGFSQLRVDQVTI